MNEETRNIVGGVVATGIMISLLHKFAHSLTSFSYVILLLLLLSPSLFSSNCNNVERKK